ncbi:MAG: thiamine phosphate synthase [Phycisphaerales bacterium]|nr:MAG: thiamine phosphate synthase [Phycisphaerales bacterium]
MTINDNQALRIIDANLNRAREALRVMEEFARFGLDDAGLSEEIKETRHALKTAVLGFQEGSPAVDKSESARAKARGSDTRDAPRDSMMPHRDIVGDVGREVSTPSEYERPDAQSVALAAGKRLSEALRAIEEYGKIFDSSFAGAVEGLRYQGYEIERRLALTTNARERFGGVRLYVLLTESLCSGDWFETAQAVLAGGADCIQLREKGLPDFEFLDRAKRLAALCRQQNALFIVNDRLDIALLSNAHGVHLGQDDLTVADVRRILPSTVLIGVSTHTREQIVAAARAAPDYVAVGPMFASATKPQDYIAGPEALAVAREQTSLPLVAIGGIAPENAPAVLGTAPCCLCVCGSVISQPDPADAVTRLRAVIDKLLPNQTTTGGTAADSERHT